MSNKLDNHLAQVTADPPSKKKRNDCCCISVPDFLLFVLSFLRIPNFFSYTNEFKEKHKKLLRDGRLLNEEFWPVILLTIHMVDKRVRERRIDFTAIKEFLLFVCF